MVALASDQVDVPFAIPELGAGIDALLVDLQVLVLESASGAFVLGGPARAVLLDGAF